MKLQCSSPLPSKNPFSQTPVVINAPKRVQLDNLEKHNWVVIKIMVPFWIPIIIRHLIFRVPKKGS